MPTYNETATGGGVGGGNAVEQAVAGGGGVGGGAALYGTFGSGGGVGGGIAQLNYKYTGSGGVVTSGAAATKYKLRFIQQLVWDVRTIVRATRSFKWDVGEQPLRWYRVQGCCAYPTASGDGQGDSGGASSFPGGCEVLPYQSQDQNCKGASGKNSFFQNVLARNTKEVCEYLTSVNWNWPICDMARWSRPADNRFVEADDTCNKLEAVDFSEVQECLNLTVRTDNLVKMAMTVYVTENVIRYTGSGGAVTGGAAESSTDGSTGYDFYYHGSGGVVTSGAAPTEIVYDIGYSTDMGFSIVVDDFEMIYSQDDTAPDLSASSRQIVTQCGSCDSMPQVLELTHNLDMGAVFKEFCNRNSIDVPTVLPIHYSNRTDSWQGSLHYTGIADYNQPQTESWRFAFEWGCVNSLGSQDFGGNVWKFSMSVLRKNLTTGQDFDTRLLIAFPPNEICSDTTSIGFDFSFQVDTQKIYVRTDLDIVVDLRILYDNIGMFRSAFWKSKPLLRFTVSENPLVSNYESIDIKPIFPEETLLLPV